MEEELVEETQDANIEVDKTTENNSQGEDTNNTENVDELKKQVATLQAQKEHWRNKFEKVKTSVKDEEPKTAKKEVDGNDRLDRLELRSINPQLAEEDIQEILDISKSKKVSISEAYANPIIQGYLKSKEQSQASNDATLSSNRSPKAGLNTQGLFKPGMSEQDKVKAYNKLMGI